MLRPAINPVPQFASFATNHIPVAPIIVTTTGEIALLCHNFFCCGIVSS